MDLDFRPVVVFWAVLALGLVALETLVPGAALIWLGLAAGLMLVLVVFVPDIPIFWQAVLFVGSAFAIVGIYWSRLRKTGIVSDQPLLNRRGEQLVGQLHTLESAIVNGRGRLRIGDAYWQVDGPDLPAGARVRVVGFTAMRLQVEAA
ncbi:NfeD family protein [Silanimonas sp.]|uniref:NfeD family protein n=1 Tax=Silanimonas sp. TaxID=1929290 RepID=UPI001BB99BBB|nr:NfeD family protein [Silanimonas sp.]MBS3897132.1 NfeD family protein [Silanimonas sp.]